MLIWILLHRILWLIWSETNRSHHVLRIHLIRTHHDLADILLILHVHLLLHRHFKVEILHGWYLLLWHLLLWLAKKLRLLHIRLHHWWSHLLWSHVLRRHHWRSTNLLSHCIVLSRCLAILWEVELHIASGLVHAVGISQFVVEGLCRLGLSYWLLLDLFAHLFVCCVFLL